MHDAVYKKHTHTHTHTYIYIYIYIDTPLDGYRDISKNQYIMRSAPRIDADTHIYM